jgi:hypothetical protein
MDSYPVARDPHEQREQATPEMVSDPADQSPGQPMSQRMRDILRQRAISLRTLSAPLRLIVWLAIAQLILIGVAISARDLGLSAMVVSTADDGSPIMMPTMSFALSLLSLAFAFSFLLTGALKSPWYVRFPLLIIFSLAAIVQVGGVIPAPEDPTVSLEAHSLAGTLSVAEVGVLLLLWMWALVVMLIDWRATRRGKEQGEQGQRFPWATYLFVLALLIIHGALVEISVVNFTGVSLFSFSEGLTTIAQWLFLLLIPLFFLAGTDYAEVGEVVAAHTGHLLRNTGSPWRLAGWTALAAALISAYGALSLNLQYQASFADVGLTLLILGPLGALAGAGLLWLVIRLGRIEQWAIRRVPYGALIVCALAPVLAPILGIILVIRGRRREGGALAVAGLFFLAFAIVGVASLIKLFHLPGIELIVAPATLVVLFWLAVRRRINQQAIGLLIALLTLNIGLQIVAWVFDLFALAKTVSNDSVIALALLVIVAQLWDLLMSGEQVTNVNGRRFPRNVRVLLYVGYVMLASTLLLYFSVSPKLAFTGIDSDDISLAGLALLGAPLLVTGFALTYSHWRAHIRSQRSAEAPTSVHALT